MPDLKPDPLSASQIVRRALARGGRKALDAVNSPPVFCYAPQTDEVCSVLSLLFAQSPLHSCSYDYQIPDEPNPLFIYCEHTDRPVPQEFWNRLKELKALYLSVDTSHK